MILTLPPMAVTSQELWPMPAPVTLQSSGWAITRTTRRLPPLAPTPTT
ncbi:MAG: hypothetical protein QF426_04815 [Verrucomicrobiales bacterium]|nr:hypothetical protein [Verrucomicrobiales bacterium]